MRKTQSQVSIRSRTGGYMPPELRHKLANEIRRTHFKLGGDGPDWGTSNKNNFTNHGSAFASSDPEAVNNIRKAHFSVGTDAKSMQVEPEYTYRYKKYPLEPGVALNEELKNDLRTHHFNLGHSQSAMLSTTHETYDGKKGSLISAKDSAKLMEKIRTHNFNYGNEFPDKVSIFKSDYGPKKVDGWNDDEQLKNIKKDLRTSHFQIGHEPTQFQSTASGAFQGKKGEPSALSNDSKDDLRRQHFKFGTDKPTLASHHQNTFTKKENGKQDISKATKDDLRTSHFDLGFDNPTYVPTSHSSYRPSSTALLPPAQDSTLRKTNFSLGNTPGGKWNSTYSLTHRGDKGGPTDPFRDRHTDKATNFSMGNGPTNMTSTAKDSFTPQNGEPGKLNPETAKDIRRNHFDMGGKPGEYNPLSTEYGSRTGAPIKIDPKLLQDLRKHHYYPGFDSADYGTTYRKGYLGKHGNPASLDPKMTKDLRGTHYGLGTERGEWDTIYRGAYYWLAPKPDKDFRFTFD